MREMMHYLCHMLDPSVKQTLCVIPNMEEKSIDRKKIKDGKFFIINGQHSIAANQKMQAMDLPEKVVKPFLNWNCFIIWSKDKNRLRQISGYYNWCNHFSIFKPIWAINVLGARFIWTELGQPIPPKSATESGRAVYRTKMNAINDAKYKVNKNNNPLYSLGQFELNSRPNSIVILLQPNTSIVELTHFQIKPQ